MNLTDLEKNIAPIIFPATQTRVDVWLAFYIKVDPDFNDIAEWDIKAIPPDVRRMIVKKCMRMSRVRELICDEKYS
jgi:hypothetical protein